jgi:hypothetical protein
MLLVSGILLGLALAVGSWLAFELLREKAKPKLGPALVHGALAVAGFVLLLLTLGGPARGAATGAAGFDKVAAITLALAALPGLALFVAHLRRRRPSGMLLGTHAFLAITGCVILLTYILLS